MRVHRVIGDPVKVVKALHGATPLAFEPRRICHPVRAIGLRHTAIHNGREPSLRTMVVTS
jgi:hypothetical protein